MLSKGAEKPDYLTNKKKNMSKNALQQEIKEAAATLLLKLSQLKDEDLSTENKDAIKSIRLITSCKKCTWEHLQDGTAICAICGIKPFGG